MLEIEGLHVTAGAFQLRDVTLTVARGACHAVLGPSGSGKTTLLSAILGVRRPDAGRIRLDGTDITRTPIERRGLGYVPQHLALFPHLTVRENLIYSARARRLPMAEIQARVDKLVAATGIAALLDRRPDTLSGGERQRVGLVRALAAQPRVLLLDEPFATLNESLRREMWWMLRELQRGWDFTILLITHDLAEAYFLSDRVAVMIDGKVVQQGEKACVYAQPAAPEVARFLGIETLQPGRVVSMADGLATVEVGTTRLTALALSESAERVLVSIRGEDVMLQRDGGDASSARNIIPARVMDIRPASPLWCIELDAGFPLTALITRAAYEELQLAVGVSIRAVIKAPSVHLIRIQDVQS